jgi:hypothetical protein
MGAVEIELLYRFAHPGDPVGLACRLYPGAGGGGHSPAVQRIQAVLADAA